MRTMNVSCKNFHFGKTTVQIFKYYMLIIISVINWNFAGSVVSSNGPVKYSSGWTEKHGDVPWFGGKSRKFECPYDGVFNRIFIAQLKDTITAMQVECRSAMGLTISEVFGLPFGGWLVLKCADVFQYISYFEGILVHKKLSNFTVICKDIPQTSNLRKQQHEVDPNDANRSKSFTDLPFTKNGEKFVQTFSDRDFTKNGERAVVVEVGGHGNKITYMATLYQHKPVTNCEASHFQVIEDIEFEEVGFEVLGFTSGSTCSDLEQQISLEITEGASHTTDNEHNDGDAHGGGAQIETLFGGGWTYFAKGTLKFGLDFSGSGSLGQANITGDSKTFNKDYSTSATVNYKGPGIASLFGFRVIYKTKQETANFKIHFSCKHSSVPPEIQPFALKQKMFGHVFFLDYQKKFKDTTECLKSSYPQECVASIKIRNFVTHPEQFEKVFLECFNSKNKIPLD